MEESEDLDVGELTQQASNPKRKKKKKNRPKREQLPQFHGGRLIKLINIETKGRALVSTVPISTGLMLWREKPFCVIFHDRDVCSSCGRMIGNEPKIHVNDHDVACCESCHRQYEAAFSSEKHCWSHLNRIASASGCDIDLLRMTLRLMCLIQPQAAHGDNAGCIIEDLFIDDGSVIVASTAGVLALESHLDHQSESWRQSLQTAVTELATLLLPSASGSHDQLNDQPPHQLHQALVECGVRLASRVNVNAYGIGDSLHNNKSRGFGLFPAVGLCINHACYPNSVFTFSPDGHMEYRAMMDIPAHEEITVSYVDLLEGTPTRRRAIEEKRFFTCMCSRCLGFVFALDALRAGVGLGLATASELDDGFDGLDLGGTSGSGEAGKKKKNGKKSKAPKGEQWH